ncbi:unnamed protein product [Symbiodinium sp. CCMP2592]|nr:unnamed protein product [Symbiodinium sp. CCMP2592]
MLTQKDPSAKKGATTETRRPLQNPLQHPFKNCPKCREMQMLRESLREIVLHDDDLDLHFCAETLADPLLA